MENYDYESLKDKHGAKFKATIINVECEGKICVEGDDIYLCQDTKDGLECQDKMEYKYSWRCAEKGDFDSILNDWGVKNLEILEDKVELVEGEIYYGKSHYEWVFRSTSKREDNKLGSISYLSLDSDPYFNIDNFFNQLDSIRKATDEEKEKLILAEKESGMYYSLPNKLMLKEGEVYGCTAYSLFHVVRPHGEMTKDFKATSYCAKTDGFHKDTKFAHNIDYSKLRKATPDEVALLEQKEAEHDAKNGQKEALNNESEWLTVGELVKGEIYKTKDQFNTIWILEFSHIEDGGICHDGAFATDTKWFSECGGLTEASNVSETRKATDEEIKLFLEKRGEYLDKKVIKKKQPLTELAEQLYSKAVELGRLKEELTTKEFEVHDLHSNINDITTEIEELQSKIATASIE